MHPVATAHATTAVGPPNGAQLKAVEQASNVEKHSQTLATSSPQSQFPRVSEAVTIVSGPTVNSLTISKLGRSTPAKLPVGPAGRTAFCVTCLLALCNSETVKKSAPDCLDIWMFPVSDKPKDWIMFFRSSGLADLTRDAPSGEPKSIPLAPSGTDISEFRFRFGTSFGNLKTAKTVPSHSSAT